ncbi:M48 family metalloprotease [Streptomyces sp. Ag109_G2-15]|uniref:M48 family metalloprotease n=1 Tax=Streptomyces sp. Ag109_G2-15 TaxID=1938850 RepID=UPI000BCDD1DA|nr:M48 family metalloprotease [Streptomyces sp. Ag109_G2-15]SOE07820.1 Zn-dependent protease with chaperone function [Streptomyces sp. Ag109_G2-15]
MNAVPDPDGPPSPTPTATATERPDVARALVSSPLPLPTTTRLALLVLVAGAGASFATWWWLVLGRDNWPDAQLACLPTTDAAPDEVLTRFTGCVGDVRLAQSAVVLCGPLALLALALLCRAAGRRLSLWRWRAEPEHCSPLARRLAAVAPEGEGPRPVLWVRHGRRVGVRARASGTVHRPRIVADSHFFNENDRHVDAVFRHELAHLRLRDVGRVRLAIAASWLLLLGVTLPMAVALARDPGLLGAGLLVRMAVVLAVVLLTLCAVLRVREHDADLGAAADPRAPRNATADHLGSALPPRRVEHLRRYLGLATHPTPAVRLAVLADPARSWGLSSLECLTTGLAAGLVFTDLTLLVAALMPDHTQLAYMAGGLLTGWAVAGVVTVAWWRAVAVGHRDASGRRAAQAGAALGLGVLLGSQLAGRAAGDWVRDTGTADGLATALSLTDVPREQVLALGVVLVAGGALFALWTTSLARALGATVDGPRSAPACAAAVGLSGLLLAVPLGSWFLFARLTAARAAPDIRWAVIDTPWWVAGVLTTVVGALVPAAAARASRHPGPRGCLLDRVGRNAPVLPADPIQKTSPSGAGRIGPLALLAAATVLVAAGAGWAAFGSGPGRAPAAARSGDSAVSAAPTDSSVSHSGDRTVPLDQLPVLPPEEERTAALRTNTALVCRSLSLGGTAIWTDPQRRADTAELLGGLDDTVLRAAAAVLQRDPAGAVDRHALVASVLRCDLYFRYGR